MLFYYGMLLKWHRHSEATTKSSIKIKKTKQNKKQEVGQKKTEKKLKEQTFKLFYSWWERKKIPGSFLNIGSVGILGQISV